MLLRKVGRRLSLGVLHQGLHHVFQRVRMCETNICIHQKNIICSLIAEPMHELIPGVHFACFAKAFNTPGEALRRDCGRARAKRFGGFRVRVIRTAVRHHNNL